MDGCKAAGGGCQLLAKKYFQVADVTTSLASQAAAFGTRKSHLQRLLSRTTPDSLSDPPLRVRQDGNVDRLSSISISGQDDRGSGRRSRLTR